MIVFTVLGYILLFILFVLLLVVLIPLKYKIRAYKDDKIGCRGEISWLWPMLKIDFDLGTTGSKAMTIRVLAFKKSIDIHKVEEARKKDKKEKSKLEKDFKRESPISIRDISKDLIEEIIYMIRDVFRNLKPDKFVIEGIYGFDDPYHTGLVIAVTSSVYPLIKDCSSIKLNPSYRESILEGRLELEGRLIFIVFIFIILKFMFTKPVRKIIKKIFRKKKEEKLYVKPI